MTFERFLLYFNTYLQNILYKLRLNSFKNTFYSRINHFSHILLWLYFVLRSSSIVHFEEYYIYDIIIVIDRNDE